MFATVYPESGTQSALQAHLLHCVQTAFVLDPDDKHGDRSVPQNHARTDGRIGWRRTMYTYVAEHQQASVVRYAKSAAEDKPASIIG